MTTDSPRQTGAPLDPPPPFADSPPPAAAPDTANELHLDPRTGDPVLLPGDILLTASRGLVGRLIRSYTRDRGEAPSVVNHAALVVTGATMAQAVIVEALGSGITRHTVGESYGTGRAAIAVFRPVNLTAVEIARIVAAAEERVGQRYGYGELLRHWGDWALGRLTFRRRTPQWLRRGADHRRRVCSGLIGSSYAVVAAYAEAGKTFGLELAAATPDDLWDFGVGNPDKQAMIRRLEVWPLPGVVPGS